MGRRQEAASGTLPARIRNERSVYIYTYIYTFPPWPGAVWSVQIANGSVNVGNGSVRAANGSVRLVNRSVQVVNGSVKIAYGSYKCLMGRYEW
jgi:hypothetical protein